MKGALVSFVILNCLLFVWALPLPLQFDDDFNLDLNFPELNIEADCTRLGCEAKATSCSKKISTSEDKKTLNEEVKCTDSNGNQLQGRNSSIPNPIPGSIQNGYEYFGSVSSGSQSINVNSNQHHNINLDNVENLNK